MDETHEPGGSASSTSSEVRCPTCGYDVRGLPREGRCPECGEPVERAYFPYPLYGADAAWLRRLRLGALMMGAALIGSIVLSPVLGLPATNRAAGSFVMATIVAGLLVIGIVAAYWLLTSPNPARGHCDGTLNWCVVGRAALLVSVAGACVAISLLLANAAQKDAVALLLIASPVGITGAVALVAFTFALQKLAVGLGDGGSARCAYVCRMGYLLFWFSTIAAVPLGLDVACTALPALLMLLLTITLPAQLLSKLEAAIKHADETNDARTRSVAD